MVAACALLVVLLAPVLADLLEALPLCKPANIARAIIAVVRVEITLARDTQATAAGHLVGRCSVGCVLLKLRVLPPALLVHELRLVLREELFTLPAMVRIGIGLPDRLGLAHS